MLHRILFLSFCLTTLWEYAVFHFQRTAQYTSHCLVHRPGCSFGGRFYSLEDTWHPDLGEPFGVMHCVKCYCETQRGRKGKVLGKVSCKNVKRDCPEPSCDAPVLLPGQCCKTCPKGDVDRKQVEAMFDGFEYFQEKEKEDDLHKTYNDRSYLSSEDISPGESRTDFVAVLTGVTDSWLPSSSGVARARFSLTRTSLTFSITYQRREVIEGKIIKHRALFAETFSSTLTSEEEHSGMGGIAMLTLSDTENNLHFVLILQGLIQHRERDSPLVPIQVRLQYRQHVLREIHANVTAYDTDFAEVLTDLNSRELFWLSRGQLVITVETEVQDPRHISGFITGRKSCDTIQSVMSSGDALTPGKTGGVGSAFFHLHDNGTLDYQVQLVGASSEVMGLTIELKPRRRSKRSVLYDLTPEFDRPSGRATGSWSRVEARHIHMLLQNELFINVATAHSQEGELRGQIKGLLYSGLEAPRHEIPVPLAGQFVAPPVLTSAGGHAWVSVDERCHLHYEIVVAGLSKADDLTVNAHLHGLAEIGELDERSTNHKRLLTGFYGSQAQGVLKDISVELLRHLDRGTAFIQVSTKVNTRGEIRGRVHVPNNCEFRTKGEVELAEFDDLFVRDPEELKKDPHTCFFETQHHAHGSLWTPNYNHCFTCSCQKRTVICDPVICPVLTCSRTIQPDDKCCPMCVERKIPKEMKTPERLDEHPEGCYFEGDQKMHAPGSTWHPFVPPFGYIKCALCTCKGATGEVHCEKVTCPALTCSRPVRRSPSDCCKECPEEDNPPLEHADMMQADGTSHCKFGKNFYQNSDNWHPRVPLMGEMKCITCWCDVSITESQIEFILDCLSCLDSKEEEEELMKVPEKKNSWRH
uniref:Chordin n=1 Tax=Oncorhynchus kisutch TaxID=8019 RepID=A0A8C7H6T3_ONCKI